MKNLNFTDFITLLKDILDAKLISHKLSELSKFYIFLQKQDKLSDLKIDKNTCPQIDKCTSCDYKNISYFNSLEKKHKEVLDIFANLEKKPKEIIPSPKPFAYRRRAQFHIENKKLGYHKRGTNSLVEIKYCPLLTPKINDFLTKENFIPNGKLELEDTGTTLSQRFIKERGNSFSQINESLNTLMKLYIYNLIRKIKPRNILELYGGTGNFIEYLFKEPYINKIISVDISAENAIKENGKLRFVKQDIKNFLSGRQEEYDLVILDPPRKGIEIKNLEKLIQAKYIIYIACEQSSLKTRVEFLLDNGWKHKDFILFDMFPFTKHIESISFFEKES